jgi:hypothetical protein
MSDIELRGVLFLSSSKKEHPKNRKMFGVHELRRGYIVSSLTMPTTHIVKRKISVVSLPDNFDMDPENPKYLMSVSNAAGSYTGTIIACFDRNGRDEICEYE